MKNLKYADWLKSGEYIRVDDTYKIFCKQVAGDGPDVLFIHGFPTSSFDWAKVFEKLEGQAKLTTFDLLGFGASQKPQSDIYNYEMQADIAEDVAERYAIESCVLVAHDYGVTVAQELIRRQIAGELLFKIEKVVFLNGGIYHHLHKPALIQKILLMPVIGDLVARSMTLSKFQNALGKTFAGAYKLGSDEAVELWQGVTQNDGQVVIPKLLHYIAERRQKGSAWEAAMENSGIPYTLIWGLMDPISGKHMLDYAKHTLTTAKIVELPDVGHYPQVEAPGQVAEAILQSI